jgi:hypothetical protein
MMDGRCAGKPLAVDGSAFTGNLDRTRFLGAVEVRPLKTNREWMMRLDRSSAIGDFAQGMSLSIQLEAWTGARCETCCATMAADSNAILSRGD